MQTIIQGTKEVKLKNIYGPWPSEAFTLHGRGRYHMYKGAGYGVHRYVLRETCLLQSRQQFFDQQDPENMKCAFAFFLNTEAENSKEIQA